MIGVSIFWETFAGVEHPIYKYDVFKDTFRPLGATNLFFIDEEGLNPQSSDELLPATAFASLNDFINEHGNKTLVYLEAARNIPEGIDYQNLKDFQHPAEDVVYVLGKDSSSLPLSELPLKNNYVVNIPTNDGLALWSVVAAGLTLYDRKIKE